MTKGFWIPIELMDLDISWTKRILISEISQLEMLDKGCVASNNHFSTKLRLSNQAVSKALNELEKDGLILIDNAQSRRNFGRKITINFGKSAINFGKSAIHESGESKESKSFNKQFNSDETFFSKEQLKAIISYRSKIRKPIKTQQAVTGLSNCFKECYDAGYTFEEIFELMQEKQWQTIKLEWVSKEIRTSNALQDYTW